jgi:hypothetical protein
MAGRMSVFPAFSETRGMGPAAPKTEQRRYVQSSEIRFMQSARNPKKQAPLKSQKIWQQNNQKQR